MASKYLSLFIALAFLITLPGCLGGGADGGFKDLLGGNLSDVDELTIISSTPSSDTVTVGIGDTTTFAILAQTPPPGSVSYFIAVDGTTVASTNSYNLTGAVVTSLPGDVGIGNHTVTATASDGTATKSRSWTVKVNGPPVLSNGYSTPPKVAIGGVLALAVTGTDPNTDPITYTWTISGVASAYLVGSGNTATLTANSSLLALGLAGPITINVTGEDDSGATGSTSFQVEVNAFNSTCNTLSQFQMCTYVGSPTLGDGMDPADPSVSSQIKVAPIALAVDSRNNNIIMADWINNLVWYWNRSAVAVDFLQFAGVDAIPANTIKVIAGTGAAATESGDTSLNVGLNGPRGLYYHAARNRLFISEYNANRVKVVESNGLTSYILGVGAGNIDGDLATAHVCANPTALSFYNNILYVACYSTHRVKAWGIDVANISTSTVTTIYGATSGTSATFRNDRSAMKFPGNYAASTEDGVAYAICASNCGVRNPYDIYVDADGLYVTHTTDNYVRFCNMSGAPIVKLGMTIGNNFCRHILGTGAAAFGAMPANPLTTAFRDPRAIVVDAGKIIVTSLYNNNDRVVLINATGANLAAGVYGIAINNGQFDAISSVAAGYTEGSPVQTRSFNDPYDIIVEPDTVNYPKSYLMADYTNRRLRRLNYTTGSTVSLVGSGRLRDDYTASSGFAYEFYMNQPSDILYDSRALEQAFYIMDSSNNRVLKVDRYGNVTTAAGDGSNAPAAVTGAQSPTSILLNTSPILMTGLALFNDFSMVINNRGYGHLQVWNRTGSTKSYLNAATTGSNRVNQLGGNFALANNATPTNYDDDADAMQVSLFNPSGVAVSENQNTAVREVFVADQYRHCIRKINEAGGMTTVLGSCKDGSQPNNTFPGQPQGGGGSATDSTSSLLTEVLYRPSGLKAHYPTATDATNGGGVPASLSGAANLIISDYNGNRVRYWNRSGTSVQFASVTIPDGTLQTIACTTGSNNTTENIFSTGAQCSNPVGFAMNDDYLCYSQASKHNVRCIYLTGANKGRVFTVAGSLQATTTGVSGVPYNFTLEGLAATSQKLNSPAGLTFDSTGDLYITDRANSIIKKVKMTP